MRLLTRTTVAAGRRRLGAHPPQRRGRPVRGSCEGADRRFELRAENRGVVAEVCRRLDGIPLAIELAAARVPLGVEGLRDKLDQRFHVLTTGRRTSLRRHQTLRAAL